MTKAVLVSWAKCKLAASKRLPFMTERRIEAHLDMAGMTAAEAYICGAEEAQGEILRRLNELLRPVEPPARTLTTRTVELAEFLEADYFKEDVRFKEAAQRLRDLESDYLRRHNDACNKDMEIWALSDRLGLLRRWLLDRNEPEAAEMAQAIYTLLGSAVKSGAPQ